MANAKRCSHCGAVFPGNLNVCPYCGRKYKKPLSSRWWFIVLMIVGGLFLIMLIGTLLGELGKPDVRSPEEIAETEYMEVTVDDLYDALLANQLAAEDTYVDAFVAVTGELSYIDANGEYIKISGSTYDMMCDIETTEVLDKVKTLVIGDTITVKGQIKSIDSLGYYMDIEGIE